MCFHNYKSISYKVDNAFFINMFVLVVQVPVKMFKEAAVGICDGSLYSLTVLTVFQSTQTLLLVTDARYERGH